MRPMLRWFVFTVGFGLLPFGFSILLAALETGAVMPVRRSPELLFFAVMVCGVQLGALLTEPPAEYGQGNADWPMWVNGAFLIGAIMAAGLYGMYIDRERDLSPVCREYMQISAAQPASVLAMTERVNLDGCPEDVRFLENTFLFSVWLAALLLAGGTLTEWYRTRSTPWTDLPKPSSSSPS